MQLTNASCRVSILPNPRGSKFSAPMAAAYVCTGHSDERVIMDAAASELHAQMVILALRRLQRK